jgi:hypothetical protein
MKFREVRGTRIQDLIDGRVKLEKNHIVDKRINDYLGVKKDRKEKDQNEKGKKAKKKELKADDSDESFYDFNKEDSSD